MKRFYTNFVILLVVRGIFDCVSLHAASDIRFVPPTLSDVRESAQKFVRIRKLNDVFEIPTSSEDTTGCKQAL